MRVLRSWLAAVGLAAAAASHAAVPLLSEGFDDIGALGAAGWTFSNLSTVPGTPWFQGNAGIFTAQAGAPGAYIASNFLASNSGSILNLLVTPGFMLSGGEVLSFYTRTELVEGLSFDDNLAVMLGHRAGTSIVFDTQIAALGPTLGSADYPTAWQQVSALIPKQGTPTELFIAFAYSSANVNNANYIGLDTVALSVPEPHTALLLTLGLAGLALRRRSFGVQV